MKKKLFLLVIIIHGLGFSQCPTSTVILDTQQKVDDFAVNYPNCTNLTVSIEISGTGISNLEGLKNVHTISEYLTIGKVNGSTSLKNLAGLENLELVGKSITIQYNNKLETLNGLSRLRRVGTPGFTSSGLNISNNPLLMNFGNLSNLEFFNTLNIVGNGNLTALAEFGNLETTQISENNWIHIWNNTKLSSLKGLERIRIVEGDLYVFNNNLNSLEGLEHLEFVSGKFGIRREPNLKDFSGLNSLRSVAGGIAIEENPVLVNFENLETLEEVTGKFLVNSNPLLINFTGLENLKIITGDLEISRNQKLQNFKGLDNLSHVTGTLQVLDNAEIGNFTGFSSLNFINIFTISANNSLKDFTGLNSLEKLGTLFINFNNSLTSLNGLETLNVIEGGLTIERNAALLEISGLGNVESIQGDIKIALNDKILSLNGLENISNIDFLIIRANNSLPTLKGLEKLQSVLGLSIENNENLQSLDGLNSLTLVSGHNFALSNNPNLLNLNALGNLKYVGGKISIDRNHKLEDLAGLKTLTVIQGRVEIFDNNSLRSLWGLQNIDSNTIEGLVIMDNPKLAECEVLSICNVLATDKPASFRNNLPGCNTKAEVLELCENQFNTLAGTVKYPVDGEDCGNGSPIENWQVKTSDGNSMISSYTDNFGRFSFFVGNGNYETSVVLNNDYFIAEPEVLNINTLIHTSTDSIRFCLRNNIEARDLSVSFLPISEARPGFNTHYEIVYKNHGNVLINGTIKLNFDSAMASFYNTDGNLSQQTENVIAFNFEDLKPFEMRKIKVIFQIFQPPIVSSGDILKFEVVANPLEGDREPNDNKFILNHTVINSLDPNDITVLEGPAITEEQAKGYLNYLIRFQNTGTASAVNVRVNHQMDENLDWETFQPIASSHKNKIIREQRNVEFRFDGIHLPESTANEPESHGFVAFKVKPKAEINVGDIIRAEAEIYFDFNPPIVTNEVITKVVDPNQDDFSFSISLTSEITCNSESNAVVKIEASGGIPPYTYHLYDSSNSILFEGENNTFHDLLAGTYTVRVKDAGSNEMEKPLEIQEPEKLTGEITTTNTTCGSASDGKISIVVSGGTAPFQYRLGDGDFSPSTSFHNLPSGEYEIFIQDSRGCTFSEMITISNSEDADNDGDGIGDSCDNDIDGDGIQNSEDECENSTLGVPVNDSGCTLLSLPLNNFTITTISETCRSENNGRIEIGALETFDYLATLKNELEEFSQNFTNTTSFENLKAGNYELCITIPEIPGLVQCCFIPITEPEDLEVYSEVNIPNQTLTLELHGGSEYVIQLNETIFTTVENVVVLPLEKTKNSLSVKTGEDCQGIYTQNIVLDLNLVIFPNPIEHEEFMVQLPQDLQDGEVLVEIFADNGQLIKKQIFQSSNGLLKIRMDGVTAGVYTLKTNVQGRSFASRIIKK